MKIFMTGGTGFVGGALTRRFVEDGNEVTVLARAGDVRPMLPEGAAYLDGDPNRPGAWQEEVGKHQAVVNLAGASIFKRWSEANKRIMRESRLRTTANVVAAMAGAGAERMSLISASAVGYYGSRGDEVLLEYSERGEGFLADLAADWEEVAIGARESGCRVVLTRFGVVLGAGGGALEKLIPLFKRWLGSPLGSGKQWFSWIQQQDLVDGIAFLLKNPDLEGPVNFTAPEPVTNQEMTRILGDVLGKPTFMPSVPRFALSAVMGERSSLLLDGQRALPGRLMDSGFSFRYPTLEEALKASL